MRVKDFWSMAKNSVIAWKDDDATSMGAAIAFYTVFSITPLLLIVIAVAGFVWGEDAVRGEIMRQLSGLVGDKAAAGVESLLSNADRPAQGITATLISVGVLVVGSTTVFAELQGALDRIWKAPSIQKTSGLWNMLRARVLSFGLVLGLAFLLLVSLIVSAALAALGRWSSDLLPGWEFLLQMLSILVSISISTVLFGFIYKFMPQAKVAWRDVIVGAVVTAVLFEIGKVAIAMYVGKSAMISSLTAAGSLVIVLIWVYYAALVFLLGAEFTWYYAHHHGSAQSHDDEAADGQSNGRPHIAPSAGAG